MVGAWVGIAGTDLTFKATLGDVLPGAVVGSAGLKAAVKNRLVGAPIDLGLAAGEALVLGNAFLAPFNLHTHTGAVWKTL